MKENPKKKGNRNEKKSWNSLRSHRTGPFWNALAIALAQAGKEVIAIDRSEEKIKNIRRYTDYAFVAENLSMETLKEIGIQNCDVAIICIGEKVDVSILTTMSAIELGVPHVIAKATSEEQGAVLKKIGAEVVYPERDMALRLGKKLVSVISLTL